MFNYIKRILGFSSQETSDKRKRSSKWPGVRNNHLKNNPTCYFCGSKENLQVHHIRPFHIYPELELDENNLITLCNGSEKGMNCHFFWGHFCDWNNYNINVYKMISDYLAEKRKKKK